MQAKSLLYGRRIRGDVGPLNLDPARRLPGRILGPAVSLTGYLQDYDEASDIQHFTLGSRMQVIGGKVFYYARVAVAPNWVGGAPVPGGFMRTQMGAKNSLFQSVEGLPAPSGAVVTAIVAAGATQVEITVGARDGVLSNGAIALSELVGGHIVVFPNGATPRGIVREIIANTATVALVMTVTLDRPLPIAIPAGSRAACMASEYSAVQISDDWKAVLGVTMVDATSLQYIWLQTWGPTWMSGSIWTGTLNLVNNTQVTFGHDGSLRPHVADNAGVIDVSYVYAQHAGYVMATLNNYDGFHPGSARGAPFVCLQITP